MNPNTISQLQELKQGNPPPADASFFGATIDYSDAQIVLLPVPFEATTSYGGGASKGPAAMLTASHQLDLVDAAFGEPYLCGISLFDRGQQFLGFNDDAKEMAQRVIQNWGSQEESQQEDLILVNNISNAVNGLVFKRSQKILSDGKVAAVLGGDHSVPLGLMAALAETYEDYGVLHIDAHHDLRQAYEGFTYSHASIMYNALSEIPQISSLLSLGIRDYCQEEREFALSDKRINTLYDYDLSQKKLKGESFYSILKPYLKRLPKHIYISFDIDGLDPSLCPNTGTPVPGGLTYNEACFLLEMLVDSGKTIIGFDLSEVAPDEKGEWDANVGARILYKLCGTVFKSQMLKNLLADG